MKRILTLILFLATTVVSWAYDIAVENPDGVTIYYNYINDATELEVTHTTSYNSYSGTVVIPEEVTYMKRTRKVTSIGKGAFMECTGLTSVIIPNSVTSIGIWAFSDCTSLTSITIPESITSIGIGAFDLYLNIKVTVTDFSAFCQNNVIPLIRSVISEDITLVDKDGKEIKDFVIPNDVTSIKNETFQYCSGLFSITIPYSVTSIGEEAFLGCTNLKSIKVTVTDFSAFCQKNVIPLILRSEISEYITLVDKDGNEIKEFVVPNDVTSIGYDAFYSCSGLTSVTIPNSVTSIKDYAFYNCTGLTSITIPNSVTSIGGRSFHGCYSLTSVTIGNSVTSIGWGAFFGCDGLTSVTIPNSVTTIGDDAFHGCYSLTSVTIGNSVTSIGKYAFRSCTGLTSVTIPRSVKSIGESAFADCDIPEVISKILSPFVIKTNTFSNNTFLNATLYVPTGSIDRYKETEGWKKFAFIEEGNGGGDTPEPPTPQKCATPTIAFKNGKLVFDCETEGVEFVYKVSAADSKEGLGNDISMTGVYIVTVYAAKAGYENSDTVTQEIQVSGVTGDVNGDGIVDISDYVGVANIILTGKP